MAFSSYPTVRAALVALFKATLNQPGDPSVYYGHPGRQVPGRYVVVGAVVGTVEREPRTRPLRSSLNMREDYSIAVEVRSLGKGKNDPAAQQAAVEDVDALITRLDAALLADPSLGELVTHCWVGPWSTPEETPLEEGRESVTVFEVVVSSARIPAQEAP